MGGISLLFVFLFSHGFIRRKFTDRRKIWHTGGVANIPGRSFEIRGRLPQGRRNYSPKRVAFRAPYRGIMHFANALVLFSFTTFRISYVIVTLVTPLSTMGYTSVASVFR